MNPKPFSSLNHFTVPDGMRPPYLCAGKLGGCSRQRPATCTI
jgi:hypothetical protein